MHNSVLYKNLISATSQIVTQFGRGIVCEPSFVNILSDLYPERDNPAIFKILKTIIQDGVATEILNAGPQSIAVLVRKRTSDLCIYYGYDETLAEGILYSLAIGYGTMSIQEYNTLRNQRNRPISIVQNPQNQPQNNPSSSKAIPKNNKTKISPAAKKRRWKFNKTTAKHVALLMWGTLGLIVSPYLYAVSLTEGKWWPLPSSLLVAGIQLFTVLPTLYTFVDKTDVQRNQTPRFYGACSALAFFAILYWVLFPIIFGIEAVQSFFSYIPNEDGFPSIVTIALNLFCAFVLSAPYVTDDHYAKKISTTNFKNILFKKGFLILSGCVIGINIMLISIPFIANAIVEFKISKINSEKEALKDDRSKYERKLSFAQYDLGDSFETCISKIKEEDKYETNNWTLKDNLLINEENYREISDSLISVTTTWNNEKITIDLYFLSNQNLFAIQFTPRETDADSLLNHYVIKYGEPEYYLTHYGYSIYGSKPTEYYWTFKNGILKIDYRSDEWRSYFSNHVCTITYFDRRAESILHEKHIEEKRIKDSIDRANQEKVRRYREQQERLLQEQKRQEEQNHLESMKQI